MSMRTDNQGFPQKDKALVQASQKMAPTGFKVLATLAKAAPGLYIIFQFPSEPAAYVGPFVSLALLTAAKPVCGAVFGWARARKAKSWEMVRHE